MEKEIRDIKDLIGSVATELKLTVHITNQNSEAIKSFLTAYNDKQGKVYKAHNDLRTDLALLQARLSESEKDHKELKAFVWKLVGTGAMGVFGIVIYLIQLSIKLNLGG